MDKWDQEEKGKELLRIVCKHCIKKSIPPIKENFPDLLCKVCVGRMNDFDGTEKGRDESIKDVFLLCPDCLSKEIRDKPFWKDWYKIALQHYQSIGYETIPCMDDTEMLKVEQPTLQCDCSVCDKDINEIKDPGKPDEFGCYIKQYFHCKKCMPQKPDSVSGAEWARINVGLTAKGMEVWCARCNISILNMDFKGFKPEMIR